MTRAIIVEDEQHSAETIKQILEQKVTDLEIVGHTKTVNDSIEQINILQPDLLFLDIDLPDGTSFDILQKIDYKKYKIIFITAHEEYAIKAIKFSAFDFILKPFDPMELIATVNDVLKEKMNEDYELKFQAFFTNFNNSLQGIKKIVLKTVEKIYIVDVKDIIRCQSENTYTNFFINNGRKIIVSKNIKKYEEMLTDYGFMRVHQSHLINLNYISYFDKSEGGAIVMSDNSNIPVSSQKKQKLFKYLDEL
nr:LytTR family DNA-binding domain-containing protein [uncultured Sphaerochaeta sp.]